MQGCVWVHLLQTVGLGLVPSIHQAVLLDCPEGEGQEVSAALAGPDALGEVEEVAGGSARGEVTHHLHNRQDTSHTTTTKSRSCPEEGDGVTLEFKKCWEAFF